MPNQQELYQSLFNGKANVSETKGGPLIGKYRGREDARGDEVEGYKIKGETKSILDKIRKTQKQIQAYQAIKNMISARFNQTEEALSLQSQILLNALPAEPVRDLQGMEFPDEGTGDANVRY